MEKRTLAFIVSALAAGSLKAQDLKIKNMPANVKLAFEKKYPEAVKVSWEKEKGNYEANCGGKSGEDYSAQFTPTGTFIEIVKAVKIADLPALVALYVRNTIRVGRL